MKYIKKIYGLPIVCIGVLILLISSVSELKNINVINIMGVAAIIIGIITYTHKLKKESDY